MYSTVRPAHARNTHTRKKKSRQKGRCRSMQTPKQTHRNQFRWIQRGVGGGSVGSQLFNENTQAMKNSKHRLFPRTYNSGLRTRFNSATIARPHISQAPAFFLGKKARPELVKNSDRLIRCDFSRRSVIHPWACKEPKKHTALATIYCVSVCNCRCKKLVLAPSSVVSPYPLQKRHYIRENPGDIAPSLIHARQDPYAHTVLSILLSK